MEFDADQVFRSPYHPASASQAISNDQKGKLRWDAPWADHLERRPSVGLVSNETGDRAPVELDASRLQSASFQLGITSLRYRNPNASSLRQRTKRRPKRPGFDPQKHREGELVSLGLCFYGITF